MKDWILPFTLQELMELVTRTRDEDNKLPLVLSSPAHSIETGIAEGFEKTRILIFCFLCLLPGLLL
jgi:hypothetical protein